MPVAGFDRSFEKQPFEQLTIRAEFAEVYEKLVVSGYTLSSVEVKVFDMNGTDVTTNMVEGSPSIDAVNYYVFVTIKGGADGQDYYARFRTIWTKSGQPEQRPEKDLLIKVRQVGF